jgi:hypothetical protein
MQAFDPVQSTWRSTPSMLCPDAANTDLVPTRWGHLLIGNRIKDQSTRQRGIHESPLAGDTY